jgi:phosphoacetylglucosamine mutase
LKRYTKTLHVDCANGVGAIALKGIERIVEKYLNLKLYNTDTKTPELLNQNCGAEHVHKE